MMNEFIIKLVIAIVGSNAALFGFIQYLIDRHDRNKVTPEKQALLALCSERCETLLHKWMRTDEEDRTVARWAAIKRLYEAYRALGGNGEIEELYNLACEIKPKKQKER